MEEKKLIKMVFYFTWVKQNPRQKNLLWKSKVDDK